MPPFEVDIRRTNTSLRRMIYRQGGITSNLSILKTGKAKAIRLDTLEAICRVLDCQPGDIIEYRDDLVNGEK